MQPASSAVTIDARPGVRPGGSTQKVALRWWRAASPRRPSAQSFEAAQARCSARRRFLAFSEPCGVAA